MTRRFAAEADPTCLGEELLHEAIELVRGSEGVVTRWDDDPTLIPLTSHRLITIQIGTQLTELPNFVWTGT